MSVPLAKSWGAQFTFQIILATLTAPLAWGFAAKQKHRLLIIMMLLALGLKAAAWVAIPDWHKDTLTPHAAQEAIARNGGSIVRWWRKEAVPLINGKEGMPKLSLTCNEFMRLPIQDKIMLTVPSCRGGNVGVVLPSHADYFHIAVQNGGVVGVMACDSAGNCQQNISTENTSGRHVTMNLPDKVMFTNESGHDVEIEVELVKP
jgi:hypothetical protein